MLRLARIINFILFFVFLMAMGNSVVIAQVNTAQVMKIGRNALYFDDYLLSIQYFNQVINQKPYLAEPYYCRAVAKSALGDWTGAETDLTQCVELNPFVHGAYWLRAVSRQKSGQWVEAIDDYRHCLEQNPQNIDALLNIAQCQLALKNYQSADSCLQVLKVEGKRNERIMLLMTLLHMSQCDTIAAIHDLDDALALNQGNVNAILFRSELYRSGDKDLSKAVADLDQLISIDPNNVAYHIRRAIIRHRLNNNGGAISDLDYAIALDAENVIARYDRAMLQRQIQSGRINGKDQTFVEEHRHELSSLLKSRNVPFGELLDVNINTDISPEVVPDNDFFFREKSFRRSYGIVPVDVNSMKVDLTPASMFYLSYYKDEGNHSGRQAFFKEMAELNDKHLLQSNLTLLSRPRSLSAYEASERFVSLDFFNGLLSNADKSPVNLFGRAMDFLLIRNFDEAINDASQAIEMDSTFTLAYFLRFNARFLKLEAEVAHEKELIMLNEGSLDDTRESEMMIYRQKRNVDFGNIMADINAVIRLSANNPYAYYNLALVQAKIADYANALINYSHAIVLKPDLGEAYFNRGLIMLMLGDKEKAKLDLSKAGELGVFHSYNILKHIE